MWHPEGKLGRLCSRPHPGQAQFLGAPKRLDLALALRGRRAISAKLVVHQPHRQAAARVLGAFAGVVRGEALVEVVGDAAVERAVSALEEVAVPGKW